MFLLAAIMFLADGSGGGSSLAHTMVDHAVGAVRRDTTVVIRDFTKGADLFTLPGGPNGVNDVAYDSRSHEMFVLVNRIHETARLYVKDLAGKGSDWTVHELPKENWTDLVVNGLDDNTPEGFAIRIALNSKYLAVAYDGPRVRLLDRKTFANLGEIELNHYASQLTSGPFISYLALSRGGKVIALCVDNRMINSFGDSDIYLGEFGKKITHTTQPDPISEGYPCDGLVPLPGGGWAYAFQNGTVQAFFPTASGSYRRKGKALHLGEDVSGSAYDGFSGWSYFVVDGGLRSISFAQWPRIEIHRASAAGHADLVGGSEVYTFAGCRWLLEDETPRIALWEKGARGAVTYRGSATLRPLATLRGLKTLRGLETLFQLHS